MGFRFVLSVAVASVAAAVSFSAVPARAACFEGGVNCTDDHHIPRQVLRTLSCDSLWTVRNTIYRENGFCFQTDRAIAVFGNDGCWISDGARVPFNAYEQANISRIRAVEKEKRC